SPYRRRARLTWRTRHPRSRRRKPHRAPHPGGSMRIGLSVASFTWPGGPAAIAPTFARIARDADQAGLASLWVMDHFWQIPMNGPEDDPMLEGYAALAFAAAHTNRISLGTLVTGSVY